MRREPYGFGALAATFVIAFLVWGATGSGAIASAVAGGIVLLAIIGWVWGSPPPTRARGPEPPQPGAGDTDPDEDLTPEQRRLMSGGGR